jgi:hypothetical protein
VACEISFGHVAGKPGRDCPSQVTLGGDRESVPISTDDTFASRTAAAASVKVAGSSTRTGTRINQTTNR